MSYYDQQAQALQRQLSGLQQFGQPFGQQPSQTPEQIANAQRVQHYQQFLQTPEGIAANNRMLADFNQWYAKASGTPQNDNSAIMAKLQQLEADNAKLQAQVSSLSNLTSPKGM